MTKSERSPSIASDAHDVTRAPSLEKEPVYKKPGSEEGDFEKRSARAEPVTVQNAQHLQLDTGKVRMHIREHWWQIWRAPREPPPPPASLDAAKLIPLATCSIISTLTYSWMSDIMTLGYTRTLQATDLWRLDDTRTTETLSAKLDESWIRRIQIAEDYNMRLARGDIKPSVFRRLKWAVMPQGRSREKNEHLWREDNGKRHASLAWALNDVFGFNFWAAGLFKVFGDTSQLMAPLVVRTIIRFGQARATARRDGTDVPDIGRGVAMAIGLFLMTVTTSVCQHQFFWRSMTTGVLTRAALIGSIYNRGVHLTPKARTILPSAALVNHISTDVSRIDQAAQWFHAGWTAPVQVSICLIILCVQLGPSALAGFSLFVLIMPLQERVMTMQFNIRRKSMQWTDKRAKLLTEILAAMRVVKYFTYELSFLDRIFGIRRLELHSVRKIQFLRSSNIAFAWTVPVLAATIALVAYSSTSDKFDAAIVFSSLALFQLLRQPLMLLPRALSAISDSRNAFERLGKIFHADLMNGSPITVIPQQEPALLVREATFEWEESSLERERRDASASKAKGKEDKKRGTQTPPSVPAHENGNTSQPFRVQDVSMDVPRGSIIAIVGPVGSGKSSLLQGLIGEMRKVRGEVTFGGRVAYCPQTAWIQNATLRDNVLFGAPYDEGRYWSAVESACLLPDLEVLADGDLTEIGERGINLSGGQKQRVNIARALYADAEIVIFDDPLSAVDAHVGKALFANAIAGALRNRGRTAILVTHALHFLSQCDYIYTIDSGRIVEKGTYEELVIADGEFARLDRQFGGAAAQEEEEKEEEAVEGDDIQELQRTELEDAKEKSNKRTGAGTGKLEGRLIVSEKRTTGSVSWRVYLDYLKAGKGAITAPLLLLSMILMQSSLVLNTYTLVWWQENEFKKSTGFYQTLYGCLGIVQAIFTFAVGIVMDFMSYYVSENLHHQSITNIFYAPMSFFDTTPMGRILGVFGKDIDTIDDQLAVSMRMFTITIANAVGAIVMITIIEHYFIVAVVFIAFGYSYFAAFYRSSAREIKRLDAMLRSLLYSHFAESLTGLPTIRSFGEIPRFLHENKYYVDLENRALFLSVTNQRWLAIRLDFLGGIMVFVVAILAVSGTNGISPAQVGLVLTYTTSLTQLCGLVTRQSAEVENYMNSVERVLQYSRKDLIVQEAAHEVPECKPSASWPSEGAIDFEAIRMSYRSGLPEVLKGITMHIHGGEKVGIVGRTGAGKSSMLLALFRIVELSAGSIHIDGMDISKIGLRDLRSKISIIPQDPLLFSGTIRSNLDPFSMYDDAKLWDSLRRSYLIEDNNAATYPDGSRTRFTLDSVVESEGANLSQGERSLLSIARALVKNSKVVILDEATASVDLSTDAKIQHTIRTEFSDRTLLCIAHRLRTILGYDRILVLDAGAICEFDTPVNLFMKEDGAFRSMCERSNITMEDIVRSQSTA